MGESFPFDDKSVSIYPAREDTRLLLPFALAPMTGRLLEIGCGNGVLSLAAARRGTSVVATDLNPFALGHLARLARRDRLPLACVRADLMNGLGRFDRVLANPPYLPTEPAQRDPDAWQNIATDGGPDGCRVTARIVASLPDHLTPRGQAFLVVSSLQSPKPLAELFDWWKSRGGRADVVASRLFEGERLEVWRLARGSPKEPSG
jgi:release factor glutamine methyltransferase